MMPSYTDSWLIAYPNTNTLPSEAHPYNLNKKQLIVYKYCYYVLETYR